MTRRRKTAQPAEPQVITVISDDDEDDDSTQHVNQQGNVEVVQLADDSPGPHTRAHAAAAGAGQAAAAPEPANAGKAAAAAANSDSDAEDSGNSCIICMELMAEQGSHRPAALKCGHIFGEGCIRRWLREKTRCPQCNKQARVRDITALFNLPKKVAAGTGGAAVELEQQLQKAQQLAQKEHQRAAELEVQLQRMQQELSRQRRQPPPPPPPPRQPQPMPGLAPGGFLGPLPYAGSMLPGAGPASGAPPHPADWAGLLTQLVNGIPLSDVSFMAFLQHPQTAACFGQQYCTTLQQQVRAARPQQQQQGPAVQLPLGNALLRQGPPQQQQQHTAALQQQLQHQQELLAAAMGTGRKRTLQQSSETDSAAAAAAGSAAGRIAHRAIPAAAAAAAAAEARAGALGGSRAGVGRAAGPAEMAVEGASGGISSPRPVTTQQTLLQLCLLPITQPHTAAAAAAGGDGASAYNRQQQQQMPGRFELLQGYQLQGSRAFDLDAAGTLLVVAEACAGPAGGSRLRRISMMAPGSPEHLTLHPSSGTVRCLARQLLQGGGSSSNALMAVGTDRGGLVIAKPSTNNTVATIPTQAPIWSVAWSQSNDQQLLLGLDRGRVALVDLRMTSDRALVFMTGRPTNSSSNIGAAAAGLCQPWHSLVMLPEGWQQQHAGASTVEGSVAPEALLACAAGVYSWSSKQPHDFQQLLPSSWHGGTCESLALAPDGTTLAVSFRRPLSNSGSSCSIVQPAHWLAKLAVAPTTEAAVVAGSGAGAAAAADGQAPTARCIADALAAGRQELLSSTLKLSGHDSKQLMTRGCFMPALPNLHSEQLLFASADEQRCEPVLWGCSSGARLVQCGSWPGLSSPVVQLSAGVAPMFNTLLLGALSERELKVFNYAYHA